MEHTTIWPGEPYPLGATFDGTGTNFSLFSEVAERVELCLFDEHGKETRVDVVEVDGFRWHGYLPHAQSGQRYGYRVHGPWAPDKGQRCNPAKLLLDPYAKAIEGDVGWDEAVFPYWFDNPEGPPNDRDSAPFVPKSVVTSPYFDWGNERPPRRPIEETVDGNTRGIRNYWGYNSIGYLAPHNEYSSAGQRGQQVQEFKQMVRALHEAGIEVILDVVYNHTGEGNHMGPMLCFKGIDTPTFCSSSWTACATGSSRCTSTAFGLISPPPWRASSTPWIACPGSST